MTIRYNHLGTPTIGSAVPVLQVPEVTPALPNGAYVCCVNAQLTDVSDPQGSDFDVSDGCFVLPSGTGSVPLGLVLDNRNSDHDELFSVFIGRSASTATESGLLVPLVRVNQVYEGLLCADLNNDAFGDNLTFATGAVGS